VEGGPGGTGRADRQTDRNGKANRPYRNFSNALKNRFSLFCVTNQTTISKIYKKTRKLSEKLYIITTVIN
jgi:hypothetical protein